MISLFERHDRIWLRRSWGARSPSKVRWHPEYPMFQGCVTLLCKWQKGNQSVSYWYSAIPLPPIQGSQELCCLKICSTGLASYAQCSLETQSKSGIFRCCGPKSLGTSLKAKHCAVHESSSSNDFRVLVTPGHEANMNLVKLKKLTKRFR